MAEEPRPRSRRTRFCNRTISKLPHLEIRRGVCLSPQHPRQSQQLRDRCAIFHRPSPLGRQSRRQQLCFAVTTRFISSPWRSRFFAGRKIITSAFRSAFDTSSSGPAGGCSPTLSGGVGAGFIDSTDAFRNGQGQDFTFNILTAAGFDYRLDEHWKINAGVLYQHLSNGGQTDPNPSLNLLGPQVGATFSF